MRQLGSPTLLLTSPVTLDRSFILSESNFFHRKDERFGAFVLCRLLMPSPVILKQPTLNNGLNSKTVGTRLLLCSWSMACTSVSCLSICPWPPVPVPRPFYAPVLLLSQRPLWLPSSIIVHIQLLDYVVFGHSRKHPWYIPTGSVPYQPLPILQHRWGITSPLQRPETHLSQAETGSQALYQKKMQ